MAVMDVRLTNRSFDASSPGIVAFGSVYSSATTGFAWNTSSGHRVLLAGTGFSYGPGGKLTAGTATRVQIDLLGDGHIDATISRLSVPAASLVRSPAEFWSTLLHGDDTIYAPAIWGSHQIFGDYLSVVGSSAVTAGHDRITGTGGGNLHLFGDTTLVGSTKPDSGSKGTLTGGRDTLVANHTSGTSLLVGDAGTVGAGSTLNGNADVLTGSISRPDYIVGDADRVTDGIVRGGNDWMSGRGSTDYMVGDVRAVRHVPGSTGALEVVCGHDRMYGGDAPDTMIGDIADIPFALTAAEMSASGGNDQIHGGGGNDLIYGDTLEWRAGVQVFGHDKLFGDDGNDRIYGDFVPVDPATLAGGNDYLNGGGGDDQLQGNGGQDVLVGGSGDDFLIGDTGNDRLSGGAGADKLEGGSGDDRLFGDEGAPAAADRFYFRQGGSKDVILDFQNDLDEIAVGSDFKFADAAAVVATATVSGTNVVLHLDANTTVTLYNYGLPPSTLENDIVIV